MGNDGVINGTIPMPCSSDDNEDIPYLKKIFEFIESNPNQFDSSRIYAEGFSQNSVFSAYLGFCFNDKVIGISQGGSGLAKSGQRPFFPGCEGHVRWSDHLYCSQNHINCANCIKERPCAECQYWPISIHVIHRNDQWLIVLLNIQMILYLFNKTTVQLCICMKK